ncbi:7888_t:CDS:2, partial [Racocetra persica]
IRSYYEHNSINTFSFSRPVNKNPDGVKSTNEFLDLWTEKTILVSEDHFPTVLRRSEVVQVTMIEVSPIENAVAAMKAKNRELIALEAKYNAYLTAAKPVDKINTNPLSMSLNGAVDAPVNGGVPMYKKAFFSSDFLASNPDKETFVNSLKEAIEEQEIYKLSERKKAKAQSATKTTIQPNIIAPVIPSPTSPFPLPSLNMNRSSKAFRVPSLYGVASLNTEQLSPVSPTSPANSSIMNRVVTTSFNSSRGSI